MTTLIADDKRFRDPNRGFDAYAEAWALTYYLLKNKAKSEAYVKYLAALAQQKPLIDVEPAERLKQFKQFFGEDLLSFENDFLRYMRGVN